MVDAHDGLRPVLVSITTADLNGDTTWTEAIAQVVKVPLGRRRPIRRRSLDDYGRILGLVIEQKSNQIEHSKVNFGKSLNEGTAGSNGSRKFLTMRHYDFSLFGSGMVIF